MQKFILPGATSQSIIVHMIRDDGSNATGLTAVNFTLQTRRGVTGQLISWGLSNAASIDAPYVAATVIEITEGNYRVDLPDDALAVGVDTVEVYLISTNCVQEGAPYMVDFNWADMIVQGTYSPVLQHDIDPSFVWRIPRRLSGVTPSSDTLAIYVGETARFAFDLSHILDSKPRMITAMEVVPAGGGLEVETGTDGETVGVRNYLAMGQFKDATLPGTFTVRYTVQALSGELVIVEGIVTVKDVTT